MHSFGSAYRAVVVGASGAIGQAFVRALASDPNCVNVIGVSRRSHPGFSLESETSMAQVARALHEHGPFELIIDATGALTLNGQGPEKHLGALNTAQFQRAFEINTIGPALLIKHLSPLMATQRGIYAKLSARVGSISDNKKGGWYSYRASKAALNMVLQTAAIEIARKNPNAIVAALQPGTVASPLSAPFVAPENALSPDTSVRGMLTTLDQLLPTGSAQFYDYKGQAIGW